MSRKRKISNFQTTAVDRISECPDSVLSHILSLLPIEDAVKTEVLSKRWQFLWTFLPSFLFHFHFRSSYSVYDDSDSGVTRKINFVTFVDKTQFFSNCSKLKKFGVDFGYEPRFASNVNSWTRFAVGKGVEELCLEFLPFYGWDADKSYELPQLLYANSWFKELRFSFCRVTPKGNVAWNSLKKLSIASVELSEDVIERILAGSHVLELLELHDCKGFRRLDVTNSCVKKLVLIDLSCSWDFNDEGWEISAPYLVSVEISGSLEGNCRFMDVSSLVDAVFNCNLVCSGGDRALENEWIQHMVGGLLASLAHVKNLALGTLAIEVLAIMEAKGLSSPLLKCKCLTLHTHINKRVLLGIGSTLKSMPNLETLAMTLSLSSAELFDVELEELCSSNEEQYWTAQKWTYKCLTLHLKNVKIAGSWWCCDSNFLAFIQLLLRNARVLQKQKMAINKPNDYRLEDYFQAAQKLLRFPRSSPDAEVVFC